MENLIETGFLSPQLIGLLITIKLEKMVHGRQKYIVTVFA